MNEDLNGYKQISEKDLDWSRYDNRKNPKLRGKVIENIGLVNRGNGIESQALLITFTDKTYIFIGCDLDEYDDPMLVIKKVKDMSMYSQHFYDNHFHFNEDGTMWTDLWIDMLIDFGLWEVDQEKIKQAQFDYRVNQRKRDYARYLELKAIFEPDDEEDGTEDE